jgi:hypothetical protein
VSAERDRPDAAGPAGFILHASRCGSTLVARMLAELDGATVISESPELDRALRGGADPAELRAAIAGLAPAGGSGSRVFFKLDSWGVLDVVPLRAAFPGVPSAFLYRRPEEIVASHMRERGMHTVPGQLPAELFGIDPGIAAKVTAEQYCAMVTGAILDAAARAVDDLSVLLRYDELPDAVPDRLLPALGTGCGPAERGRMLAVAQSDAKRPGLPFAAGDAAVAPAIRDAAQRWAGDPFSRLEAARRARGEGP